MPLSTSIGLPRSDNERRRTLGLVAVGLMGSTLVGRYGLGQGIASASVAVLVLGGGLAAWNASADGGLVSSWLLVGSLVLPWAVFQSNAGFWFIPWFVALSLVVGLTGHLAGVGFRTHVEGERRSLREAMPVGVIGRGSINRQTAFVAVLAASVTGVVALVGPTRPVVTGVPLVGLFVPHRAFYLLGGTGATAGVGAVVALAWVGVAAAVAYQERGLLVSWGIVFGPVLGAVLAYAATRGIYESGTVLLNLAIAVPAALTVGVVFGTIGFALGTALSHATAGGRAGSVNG